VTNHTVWAVINHNSDYAVVEPVPEPSTWILLMFGAGLLVFFPRRTEQIS